MRNTNQSQRGIALLTVITALFALMVIAVPFAITMRMGYERTRANTARMRAQNQVDSTMRFLEAYLMRTTERVEIANRAADRKGDNSDPEVDTQAEIQPSLDTLAGILGEAREDLQDPYGTILGYEVEDENGKLNINSASFFAVGNLLGLSVLAGELEPGARTITLEDATAFPGKGYVKIGRELVKYGAKEGNRLLDCERSLLAGSPDHGSAVKYNEGQWVVNFAAWAISTYGISRHPGEFTYFETLDVSDISRLYPDLPTDVPVITQADWERVLPYVTIFSKGEIADGWANVQAVVEGTSLPSQEGDYDTFNFENSYFFNCGTVLRLIEKAETNVERDEPSYEKKEVRPRRRDYAMTFDAQPAGRFESQMELFGKVHRTFDGNQMRVQYRTRHPVNLNTAPREVLLAVFTHLTPRNRPQERVTPEIAAKVVDAVLKRRDEGKPFQGFEDLKLFLNDLQSAGTLSITQRNILYRNSLNPSDNGLVFGTVPLTFRTFDVYTLKATATISDRGGLLAKHSSTRVVEVGAQLTASRTWETQRDFEEQLILSNDPRYWTTGPVNTGSFVKENVEPWPRWQKQLLRHLFPWDPYGKEKSRQDRRPYETRESAESQEALNGDIRLAPARMMLDTALSRAVEVRHFDRNDLVEGNFVQGGYRVGLKPNDRDRLIPAVVNDELRPFSVQFWWKPESATSGNPTLFDIGEREYRNRYACYYDSGTRELVFLVADNTEINRAAEIRYDTTQQGGLQQGVWYHIQLVASGCHPSKMAMIVDGRAVGRSNILTHLSSSLSIDDGTLSVENADGFPETGAVLVGTEVVEYQARAGGTFTVRQDSTGNIVGRGARGTRVAEHPRDTTVVLFGYSRPIVEDLRQGGASLEGDLGPWAPVLMDNAGAAADAGFDGYTGHQFYSVSLGGSGSPAPPTTGGLVMQGAPPPTTTTLLIHTVQLTEGQEISGFTVAKYGADTANGTVEDQLSAFQEEGYCLVAYVGGATADWTDFGGSGRANCRGVVEFMRYRKSANAANGITLMRIADNDGARSAPERDKAWEMLVGYKKGSLPLRGARVVIIPVSIRATETDADRYINPVRYDHITYWVAQLLTQPGADTDVWEWFRYSELILRGGFAYFLQARVPNERLLLDAANDPNYDSELLDWMAKKDTSTPPVPDPGDPGSDPGGTPPDDGGGGGPGGPGSPGDPPTAPPTDGGGGEDVPTPPSDDPGDPSDGPGGEIPPDEPPRDNTPPGDGPGGEVPPDEPPRDDTPPDDGAGGEVPSDEPPRDDTPPDDGGGGELPPSEGGPTPPDDPDPPPTDPSDPGVPPQDPNEPQTPPDEDGYIPFNSVEALGNIVRMRGIQSDRDRDGAVDDWWGQGATGSDRLIPSGALVGAVGAVYGGPEPENAWSGAVTEGTSTADATGSRFCVWPLPGKGDKITLVNGDDSLSEGGDNLTVFWAMTSTNRRLYDVSSLAGVGDVQPYSYRVFLHLVAYNRHLTNRFRPSEGLNINRADARPYARMLAFPSGEMPDNYPNLSPARIAARFSGSAHPATIDEVHGAARPGLRGTCTVDEVTGEESTTITVISDRGTPASEDIPDAPGVLRIGEELVVYKDVAIAGGYMQFTECTRGVMRTTPRTYQRGTPVEVLFGIRVGILTEGVSESSHALVGIGFRQFARTLGCVRLEGPSGAELRIYTVNNGSSLLCPVDDTGAAIFNGRYGSIAGSHQAGTPVFWQPVRYWDLFTEFTDDPNLSFWQFSTEFTGALVKRIYWEEGRAPQRINVRAVARLNDAIDWNASAQNIVYLSRDGDTSGNFGALERRRTEGDQNPQRFLYAMEDPQGDNLLNIEADKVEVRLFVIYEKGAFTWGNPAEAGWKDTPRLESFNIEYTQQNQVRRHIDTIR